MSLDPVEVYKKIVLPIPLEKSIELKDVHYSYPNSSIAALSGVNLSIPSRSIVGLVGATGSGKTTSVDLILGLLDPQKGNLFVDGQVIDSGNRREWQRCIGYVPQQIYLADDSISANIAFGVNRQEIVQQAVENAAKIANLHDFIIKDLPEGYNTTVGERGVRLSGGQRQRIGIARALYHNPSVLILDEATSALDNITERAVMDAVNNLGHNITIILIAHRLSTVRQCDQIYLLENGQIKASGTFEELSMQSNLFQKMTGTI
jgi:ABC-type multidrug transport system fused ATPase/permease subunit